MGLCEARCKKFRILTWKLGKDKMQEGREETTVGEKMPDLCDAVINVHVLYLNREIQ